MESRGARPIQDYLKDIKALASNYNASLTRCTGGFDEWIYQVFENVCSDSPRGLVGMGPHPRPEHPTLEISHVSFNYTGPERQPGVAPLAIASPLPTSYERLDDCESPSKKARTDPESASPLVPLWARDTCGLRDGGSRVTPVASPCRNGPVGRLGPVPKDPPPRDLCPQAAVEEPELRELSSPKKRLREDRPGNSPSPCSANGAIKALASDERPAWQMNHPFLFAPASQAKGSSSLGKVPQLPVAGRLSASTVAASRSGVATAAGAETRGEGRDSVAEIAKRIQTGIETPQSSSGPSVRDRMRLFENRSGTPAGYRPPAPGSASAPVASPAFPPGVPGSNPGPTRAPVTPRSLTPVLKPKTLFGGMPDASHRSHSGAPSGRGPQPQTEGGTAYPRTASAHNVRSVTSSGSLAAGQQQPAQEAPRLKHVGSSSSLNGAVGHQQQPQPPRLKHTASAGSLHSGGMAASAPQQKHAASSLGSALPLKGSTQQKGHTASSSSLGSQLQQPPQQQQLKHTGSTSSLFPATAQRKNTASDSSLGSSGPAASAPSLAGRDSATAPTAESVEVSGGAASDAAYKKKVHRRSACLDAEEPAAVAAAAAVAPPAAAAPAAAHADAAAQQVCASSSDLPASSAAGQQRVVRPPVPIFEPQPQPEQPVPCHMLIRQMELTDKLAEDNYEVSEHGVSDGEEDGQGKDRSGKHVPKWCSTFLEDLQLQRDIDPDTIWGDKVPHCALEEIFPDEMYKQAGKNRPKRARGSSGDWRKDRLRREEIAAYKSRMGHVRPWTPNSA